MVPETSDPFRTVSLSGFEPPSRESPVALTVEVTRPHVTPESTAEVEVSLTWDGNHPVSFFSGEGFPLIVPKTSAPRGVVLTDATRSFDRTTDRPECWKPNLPADDAFGYGLGLLKVDSEPGETHSTIVSLWSDHQVDGCLDPGEYTFRESVSYQSADADEPTVDEYRFTLRIER